MENIISLKFWYRRTDQYWHILLGRYIQTFLTRCAIVRQKCPAKEDFENILKVLSFLNLCIILQQSFPACISIFKSVGEWKGFDYLSFTFFSSLESTLQDVWRYWHISLYKVDRANDYWILSQTSYLSNPSSPQRRLLILRHTGSRWSHPGSTWGRPEGGLDLNENEDGGDDDVDDDDDDGVDDDDCDDWSWRWWWPPLVPLPPLCPQQGLVAARGAFVL